MSSFTKASLFKIDQLSDHMRPRLVIMLVSLDGKTKSRKLNIQSNINLPQLRNNSLPACVAVPLRSGLA